MKNKILSREKDKMFFCLWGTVWKKKLSLWNVIFFYISVNQVNLLVKVQCLLGNLTAAGLMVTAFRDTSLLST